MRAGTIFAHDERQHQRWLSQQRAAQAGAGGGGLAGEELERVILAMAHTNPDIVTVRRLVH